MARRDVSETTGWDAAWAHVAYTADALALAGEEGDADVGALAPDIEKLAEQWATLDERRRARQRAVGRSNALARRRIRQAIDDLTRVHHATIAHVGQRRDDPLFKRLFPTPLSGLKKQGLEALLGTLRTLQLKLADDSLPVALRNGHVEALRRAIDAGDASVRLREESAVARGQVTAQIDDWRDRVNRALLGVEGQLKTLASVRDLDREWVDSYFPAPETPRRSRAAAKTTGGEPVVP